MVMGLLVATPEAIYNKTAKGREILQQRQHGLHIKHRQVLILFDGARNIGAITAMLAGMEVHNIVKELQAEGLIEPISQRRTVNTPTPSIAPPVAIATPAALTKASETAPQELDPVALTKAKLLMQEAARKYLGLLADKLLHEISAIQNHEQLRTALAHWNMAMRESPKGSALASQYLAEVRSTLGIKSA